MQNQQVLIDSLPKGKLTADNYRLSESAMPEIGQGQVLIKTIAFAITEAERSKKQEFSMHRDARMLGFYDHELPESPSH